MLPEVFAKQHGEYYDYFLTKYHRTNTHLIANVHIVLLFHQAKERAAHRNDVIVRVRREDDHTFREDGVEASRLVGWFAARPACNRIRKMLEDTNVEIIYRSVLLGKLKQVVR